MNYKTFPKKKASSRLSASFYKTFYYVYCVLLMTLILFNSWGTN